MKVKIKNITQFLFLLVALNACKGSEEDYIRISPYDKQIIDYFSEIALGFSDGSISEITRKWKVPMKVYLGGVANDALENELEKIVVEINQLTTDGFYIEITNDSLESNFDILIGTAKQYYTIYPSLGDTTSTSAGNYYIYWQNKSDIFYGNMFIDTNQGTFSYSTFLLRKFLTASTGLTNTSHEHYRSIFSRSWRVVNEYQPIDRDMIRLLYHPDMQTGWNADVARTKVLNILMNEK